MTTRYQDRATQSREEKQKVQLFSLTFTPVEIFLAQHGHGGGGGDDQTYVEQGVVVDEQ